MPEEVADDKEFVEYIVKALVANPKEVKVERKVDEMGVLLSLSVNPADMGKVIGKEGQTAKAIRTLLRVLGAKQNARLNLKILEPEGGPPPAAPLTEVPKEEPEEKAVKAEEPTEPTEAPAEEAKGTEVV